MASPGLTRRELLRTGLLFSASLMVPRALLAQAKPAGEHLLHLFCLGDWGTGDAAQYYVSKAMQKYARQGGITPAALLMLGDNFYGQLPGTDSPRWQLEFEEMYPASAFPGPCYAILGNHDYDDQPGGEKIQLAYARKPGTRWTMPSPWYRLDLPAAKPLVTLLCTDTHHAKLSAEDIAAQQIWLGQQLTAPRKSPWMFVCGHHPVVSCAQRGDSKYLGPWKTLFNENKVDAYICGHEHDLQHLHSEGEYPDWFVSGGGGRALHPVLDSAKAKYARETYGFLHLAIGPTALAASFVGDNGKALYSYTRKAAA